MKIARTILFSLAVSLFALPAWGQVVTVPAGYDHIYSLDLNLVVGNEMKNYYRVPYTTDNSSESYGLIESVGYFYQLNDNQVWVSMDSFSGDTTKLGLPSLISNGSFQRYVNNLSYQWNAPSFNLNGAASGSATAAKGNVEFWPINYGKGNGLGIGGASTGAYDHDDATTGGDYGSMQVHAHTSATAQTIFAFNGWGGNRTPLDVGIGNRVGSPDTDWTFAQNSNDYTASI